MPKIQKLAERKFPPRNRDKDKKINAQKSGGSNGAKNSCLLNDKASIHLFPFSL
jgi:hypothetical protein